MAGWNIPYQWRFLARKSLIFMLRPGQGQGRNLASADEEFGHHAVITVFNGKLMETHYESRAMASIVVIDCQRVRPSMNSMAFPRFTVILASLFQRFCQSYA